MEAFRRVLGVVPGRMEKIMNGFLIGLAVVASLGLPFLGAGLIWAGLAGNVDLLVLSSARARLSAITGGIIVLFGGVGCAGIVYASYSQLTPSGQAGLMFLGIAHLVVLYCVTVIVYYGGKDFVKQHENNKDSLKRIRSGSRL